MNIRNIFQIIKKYMCKKKEYKSWAPKFCQMLNVFPILKNNYCKYEMMQILQI